VKLRALIVDDERIARQRLRRLLTKEFEVEVVAEAENGPTAIERVSRFFPDVIFLDIQMPGMNGFEVVEFIQPIAQPVIVFVTAYDKHAVHAFETCAVDYLLKPFAPARLSKTLERVRNYLRNSTTGALADPSALTARRYSVRSGQRTTFIAPSEIDWIEADGNYAILHVGSKNHLLRETMSNLEAELPPNEFMRVSRSAILRLNRVEEIQTMEAHHFAILSNGQRIPLTRSVREVEARLRLGRPGHNNLESNRPRPAS
jgi:two-component system LytT family response regulator